MHIRSDKVASVFPFLFIGTLLLAGFLRFYDVPNRVLLGNETVRDAVVGFVGARELQLPITGPFSSLGAFTFGPWYWYNLIAGNWVFHTPYASWYTLAAASFGFVAVMFLIGLAIDGPVLGLVAAFAAAVVPNQVVAGLHLTQPNFLLFYSGLLVWLFLLVVSQTAPSRWLFFVFGAVYGMTASMHFQAITLGVLVLVAMLLRWRFVSLVYLLFGCVVVTIPSLVFQLLNHWHTVRMMLYSMIHMDELIYVPNSWRIYALQFWPDLWANQLGLSIRSGVLLGAAAGIAVTAGILKRKNFLLRISVVVFVIMAVMLRYYKGERFFSYYNFLSPFLFVFAALPIAYALRAKQLIFRLLAVGMLVGYALSVIPRDVELLAPSKFTVHIHGIAGDIRKQYPDRRVIMHNCKAKNLYRDFTLAFLLGVRSRPEQQPVNVGFMDEGCGYPIERAVPVFAGETMERLQITDFTNVSEASVTAAQWHPLTLEDMYATEVKWWYKEKP